VPVPVAFRFCRIRKVVHPRFSDLDAKRICRALTDVPCRAVLLLLVVVVLVVVVLWDASGSDAGIVFGADPTLD